MEVRKFIIPDWNVTRMKKKFTMTMFWEMTIESKLLNQFQWSMILVSFYSEDNVLSDEIKICCIFSYIKYQSNEIERPAFFF